MVHHSKELEQQFALQTAAAMCTAARTAPKGHGKDPIHTLVLTGEDKERLAEKMEEVGKRMMGEKWPTWYGRDANNVRAANAVVLIGAELKTRGVPNCGTCGFANCGECTASGGRCGIMFIDLGVAVASAAETASENKCDNRIMFSVGRAAAELDCTDENCYWLGIPISISGKSIFYDRGIFHD